MDDKPYALEVTEGAEFMQRAEGVEHELGVLTCFDNVVAALEIMHLDFFAIRGDDNGIGCTKGIRHTKIATEVDFLFDQASVLFLA